VNFCNFFEVFCEFLCARFFVGDVGLRPHTTLVVEALWKRCAGFMQGLCRGYDAVIYRSFEVRIFFKCVQHC
jgi:hypothetical protein